jgi:hypothetical protein
MVPRAGVLLSFKEGRLGMSGIKSLLIAAALVLAIAVPGASAETNGGGNSANAPGQVKASANCSAVYQKQFANGVIAKGGPKAGFGDPTFNTPDNCDHYYGAPGQLP